MFKSQLKAAQERVAALEGLITSAGFDLAALTSADAGPDALKDAIAANAPQAEEAAIGQAAIYQFLKDAGVELGEGEDPATALQEAIGVELAETAAFEQAFRAAGIELEKAEDGTAPDAKAIEAAITATVKAKASALAIDDVAAAGFAASDAPAPKSEDKPTEGLTGRDRFLAGAMSAQPEIFKRN